MSAFSDLLHWLDYTGVENLEADDIRKMLNEALDELKDGKTEEHREALFVVHTVLTQLRSGMDPAPGLRFLLERYQRVAEKGEEPESLRLERLYRESAAALERTDWAVGSFVLLADAIQVYLDGDVGGLESTLEELDQLLSSAWQPYETMPITPEEITAETVAGHIILREGFDFWFEALDEVESAAEEGRDFKAALRLAELGNRLLVAVQQSAWT